MKIRYLCLLLVLPLLLSSCHSPSHNGEDTGLTSETQAESSTWEPT